MDVWSRSSSGMWSPKLGKCTHSMSTRQMNDISLKSAFNESGVYPVYIPFEIMPHKCSLYIQSFIYVRLLLCWDLVVLPAVSEGYSRHPTPRLSSWEILRNSQARMYTIPPACCGCSPWSLTSWTYPEVLESEAASRHPSRIPDARLSLVLSAIKNSSHTSFIMSTLHNNTSMDPVDPEGCRLLKQQKHIICKQ